MLADLRHPHVVGFMGICESPPCIVTELCARGSVMDLLKRGRTTPAFAAELTWPRRLRMALDAATGMLYLHAESPPLIHRDLKSPNMLVDDNWRVKIADLGMSKVFDEVAAAADICSALAIGTVLCTSLNQGYDSGDGGCTNLVKLGVHGDEKATLVKYNKWRVADHLEVAPDLPGAPVLGVRLHHQQEAAAVERAHLPVERRLLALDEPGHQLDGLLGVLGPGVVAGSSACTRGRLRADTPLPNRP